MKGKGGSEGTSEVTGVGVRMIVMVKVAIKMWVREVGESELKELGILPFLLIFLVQIVPVASYS